MSTEPDPNTRPGLGRRLAGWATRPSFWVMLVMLGVGIPAATFFMLRGSSEPLPVLGEVPPFELTRHDGTQFGRESLSGKIWIANFIFTRCPTVCPKFTAKMAHVQKTTEFLGTDLQLVSFSVDPKYDTPERLEAYGNKFGAENARWSFLTGEDAALKKTVVEGFKIAMGQDPAIADEVLSIFHGEHFVLVDRIGAIRGYYASSDPEAVKRLIHDAVELAIAK